MNNEELKEHLIELIDEGSKIISIWEDGPIKEGLIKSNELLLKILEELKKDDLNDDESTASALLNRD